jgi:peptidoglycan/LPS O-acetylase OafA/YrhL
VRRACRIIPAYYVALVLTALYVGHFSWGPGHTNRVVGVWELVVHAAFLQHVFYGVSGQQGLGVNTAMWTLTAEAAFYVVLPFVVRPFLRHPWVVLSGALAVAMGWRWLVLARARGGTPSVYLASQAPGFAFHFALGMGAALLVVRLRALVDARALDARVRWGALFVAAWAVAALFAWQRAADPVAHAYSQSWALNDRFIWNVAPATAFGLLVAALAVCPAWAHLPLSNPVVRWMGEATYGTYLIHILVMLEVSRRWRHIGHQPMALWEMASLVTVEALLLGRLSYLIVEEPARRFGRAVAARLAVGRAGTGATGSSAGASAGSSAGSSAVTPGRPRTLSFPPRVEPTTPAAHSGAD